MLRGITMDSFITGIVTFTIGSFAVIINVQQRKINELRKIVREQADKNRAVQERIFSLIWERGERARKLKSEGVSET